jgi:hypothetical protein
MAPKKSKRIAKKMKPTKSKTVKRGKRKAGKAKNHIVDIGMSRPRITGQSGMTQNMTVTKSLASSMLQSRSKAQGLAQSLARGMGQSLA